MKESTHPRLRRLVSRLSMSPFRIAAYLLHATGLERIYKPRFARYVSLLELTDEVVDKLPKFSQTVFGAQVDPMNLIFVATEKDLRHGFKTAQWNGAQPASPVSLLYGLLIVLFGRSYHNGPFTPLYINIGLQDLAYQQSTHRTGFRSRHHLRIWRTGIMLSGGKWVWVAGASYDPDLKFMFKPPFILHDQDPDFDKERDYVVETLEQTGLATKVKTVVMTPPISKRRMRGTALRAKYFTDGQAVVVEL
jgi:hypothetical protein